MRLTVGPLSPAVYWRRRAVVFGVGLLLVLVLLYSCVGSKDPKSKPRAARSPAPMATATAFLDPTPTDLASEGATSPSEGGLPPAGEQPPSTDERPDSTGAPATVKPAAGVAGSSCSDAEILVTPVPTPTTAKSGTDVDLRLKIKNVSDRTCSRDVGADLQEIYIKIGAQEVWSSDTCGPAKGSDIQSFAPNFEREYQVTWNGRSSSECLGGVANGVQPEPGDYQVFGRLGTKISEPVKLTIRS